jgi:small subunit ribosomal protein S1
MSLQPKLFDNENFSELLEEYEKTGQTLVEGNVAKGVIVGISDRGVAIDIGAKSVGFVDIVQFRRDGEIKEGDVVDIMVERIENRRGELVISRDNARKYNNWNHLKSCLEDRTQIEGKILGKVKGGFAVDVNGVTCFLPKSQVDTLMNSDDSSLVGKTEKLQVLKIDEIRGNVVVSRRAVLESRRTIEKEKAMSTIKLHDVLDGVIKNITDYGAFVDFGGFDGLLHLTDISWCRVKHPSELLRIGQEVKVQVIKVDENTKRISLGMKQLQANPWETIIQRYPVGSVVKGKVTNLTNYGMFVQVEQGIEGLVHVSEMSWFKTDALPSKFFSQGQEVDVMILDINPQSHRVSLGMKQCAKNPWEEFSEKHKVGDVIEGTIKNHTEFGLFVGFDTGVDGLVHFQDLISEGDPEEAVKKFKKDEKIKVMVLGSNHEKERISLGIKQIESKSFKQELEKIEQGKIIPCVVVNIKKDFLEVELDFGLKAVIKRLDLSKNKQDQRTEKFSVGDRVEAKVVLFNNITGKILLSIKDMEEDEHEAHIYSGNSGTTIGNLIGDQLKPEASQS